MSRDAATASSLAEITVTINGTIYEREVEARKLLIHFIRDDLDLTGSHIGCDTGNCGACSVIVDGTLVKSCMMLAVQADGSSIETVEGLADGDELARCSRRSATQHALQCGYCTPGMLMSATALLRDEPESDRGRDQEGAAGQHLPLHRLLEHLRGRRRRACRSDATAARPIAPEQVEIRRRGRRTRARASRARRTSGSSRARASFVDDVKRHGMGYIHFVRSPYAHAHITSIDVSKAESMKGVYGTLTGEEVASLTDPFFQISSVPGGNIKDYALAVGKVRYVGEAIVAVVAETRELARDASELVEVEYEPLDAVTDARHAQDAAKPVLHDEAGGNLMWEGVYEWGDLDAAFAEADKIVKIDELHFHRFNSTPLEMRRRARRVQQGHRAVDDPHEQPVPRIRADHDGAGDALRARQAALRHAGHRRRVRQQDHLAPAARRVLPARAQARPSGAVDGVAHRLPHVDVARQRALVPRHRGRREERRHAARLPHEGARRRGRVAALRAARRRHLGAGHAGHVPLAEHPRSSSRRWRRTRRPCRRTAATRACSTSGSPSGSSTSSRTSSTSIRSRCASATTSAPRTCRTRRRTAASTTRATTRRCSTSRSS